jgi:Flp pilus assembly protein TadB
VTAIFLLLCSAGIGWFTRDRAYLALIRFSRYQQNLRLKRLAEPVKKAMPFQTALLYFEERLQGLFQVSLFQKYFRYLERQLERMNRRDLKAAHIFGYQIIGSVGAALLFGLVSGSLELAALAFLIGAFLPVIWLRDKALAREAKVLAELPNALEILSLCSEAGLSLEQAMDQYVKNTKPGPLKDEFTGMLEQTRSGSSRKMALEGVRDRLQLTDFSLFTTSLINAEKFGTGISNILRQLSLTMRDKQTQRAEKAVQELPVKLLFPLIFFIMPVTFLIIFGPIVLQFLKQ